ncbi:MAG: hypothetical protein O3C45_01715 [Bacteroidetes bacterium]|nr:hypothetical protein [Bacteroidota bacterium]
MTRLFLIVAWFAVPHMALSQDLTGLIEDLEAKTQFGLFSDFQAEFNDADRNAELYNGHLVGHLTTKLSRRATYFAEVSLSPDQKGSGQASLERAFFQFSFSDPFRLVLGRIHTPVSRWNSRYHHGQYLQTSINRPQVVTYGNQMVPIHSIVAEVSGTLARETGALSYMAGFGVSEDHGHEPNEEESAAEHSKNPSAYAGLTIEPASVLGLAFGGVAYVEHFDHMQHDEGTDSVVEYESILSGFVQVDRFRWALMAELLSVSHYGKQWYAGSWGYYVQAEHQLWGRMERAVVYGRYGTVLKNLEDPMFASDDCERWGGLTGGLRINVAPRVAATTEFRMYGEGLSFEKRHVYVQISAAF